MAQQTLSQAGLLLAVTARSLGDNVTSSVFLCVVELGVNAALLVHNIVTALNIVDIIEILLDLLSAAASLFITV